MEVSEMRNWKAGLTTAALIAVFLPVLNSASTRGQEGQAISPNGEWVGHVVFAKTEEHTSDGRKNYKEQYRCPIELTLKDRVFDEWFRPGFPRWITDLMTCFADSAIRINAIPSVLRANPVPPSG